MFIGDYHTHSKISDGKGTVLDNALAAKARGLKEIAATDHGFYIVGRGKRNIAFRKRRTYEELKEECEQVTALTGVKAYAGIEADILSPEGDLDLPESEMAKIDYLIAGFHKFAMPKKISIFFKMYLVTFFNGLIPTSKKSIERNTAAVIAAIRRYPIKILTHPGHSLKVNVGAVARACAEKGVLVEINAKHLDEFEGEWQNLVESGANFIVNSDAHRPSEVGDLENAFRVAVSNGIPPQRIVNYCGE